MANITTIAPTTKQLNEILMTLSQGYDRWDDKKKRIVHMKPNEQLCMVIVTQINIGVRVSDCLAMSLNSFIQYDNRIGLHIIEKKTKKIRDFTTTPEYYNMILDYCLRHNITNKDKKIFSIGERTVQMYLRYVCQYLGYNASNISSHSFRKFYCQVLYEESGYDLLMCQKAMLHQNISTTLRYLNGMQQEKLEKILRTNAFVPNLNNLS